MGCIYPNGKKCMLKHNGRKEMAMINITISMADLVVDTCCSVRTSRKGPRRRLLGFAGVGAFPDTNVACHVGS